MDIPHLRAVHGMGLVVGGAATLGLICRLPGGAVAATNSSLATPAIVLGVCILLAPALYIGLALAGAKTDAKSFAAGLVQSWRASGLVAVGLAPPLLFMVATTGNEKAALSFGVLALLCSLTIGLYTLGKNSATHSLASVCCFCVWALAALAVGARLFFRAVIA